MSVCMSVCPSICRKFSYAQFPIDGVYEYSDGTRKLPDHYLRALYKKNHVSR